MNEAGSTVAIGAIVTIVTGFGVIAKLMLNQAAKDRESERKERDADREERKELARAIKDMAGATGRQADATERSAKEAEARNGHLAELSLQGNQLICEVLETNKGIKQNLKQGMIDLKKRDKERENAVKAVKKDLEKK